MAGDETLLDKIERWVFGASAKEAVEMRVELATRRLEQRLVTALDADDDDDEQEGERHGG